MKPFASIALLTSLVLVAASPAALPHAYQFDDLEPIAAAQDHPLWSSMAARHSVERASIDDCMATRSQCPHYLRGYRRIMERAKGLNPHAQMVLINRFFNGRKYVTDTDRIEGTGRWHTLSHFLEFGGDCEDFAIAKYYALRQLGFDTHKMRVLVAYDIHARDFHALLAVELDGRSNLLENDNTIRRGGEQRSYAVSYAINEHFWWDHAIGDVTERYVKSL